MRRLREVDLTIHVLFTFDAIERDMRYEDGRTGSGVRCRVYITRMC